MARLNLHEPERQMYVWLRCPPLMPLNGRSRMRPEQHFSPRRMLAHCTSQTSARSIVHDLPAHSTNTRRIARDDIVIRFVSLWRMCSREPFQTDPNCQSCHPSCTSEFPYWNVLH